MHLHLFFAQRAGSDFTNAIIKCDDCRIVRERKDRARSVDGHGFNHQYVCGQCQDTITRDDILRVCLLIFRRFPPKPSLDAYENFGEFNALFL